VKFRIHLVMRLLQKKLGNINSLLEEKISNLSFFLELEKLAEDSLDFKSQSDLINWLSR
jgi:hypothetical protein